MLKVSLHLFGAREGLRRFGWLVNTSNPNRDLGSWPTVPPKLKLALYPNRIARSCSSSASLRACCICLPQSDTCL